jgi:hypothetical protein
MSALINALERLGIAASVELGGRWVAVRGEHGTAYVIETDWGSNFYVWSDLPEVRAVAHHADAMTAIREGLGRSGGRPRAATEETPSGTG